MANNRKTRLERAIKDYPEGTVFASAYGGDIFTSKGYPGEWYQPSTRMWHILDFRSRAKRDGNGNGVLYDAQYKRWAQIISKPLKGI